MDREDHDDRDDRDEKPLYELLGGEEGLRKIVHRFYELMDTLPSAQGIREMHPADLSSSEDKLFWFLSGWSGGPPLFHEKIGHPMLRRRHFPFKIGKEERDQWMMCMVLALEDCAPEIGYGENVRLFVIDALFRVANHMRNQEESSL